VGFHVADGSEGAVVNAFDVDAEEAIEIGLGRGFKSADVRDAGIVYKNIDTALAREFAEYFFGARLIGNIAGIGFRLRTRSGNFVCGSIGGCFVQIENAYSGPLLCETLCDSAANPAGGAGDDGDLAIETKGITGLWTQRETPRFQGMKSFCASNSALV